VAELTEPSPLKKKAPADAPSKSPPPEKPAAAGECNTPGVYHQLSGGFELKHDRLSGDDDANVKPMEINPNLNLDTAPLLIYRLN
jgi:hypothetical protein